MKTAHNLFPIPYSLVPIPSSLVPRPNRASTASFQKEWPFFFATEDQPTGNKVACAFHPPGQRWRVLASALRIVRVFRFMTWRR